MSEAFRARFKSLASQAGINIGEVGENRAKLYFTPNSGNQQIVYVICFEGDLWEFSCMSAITEKDANDIPKFLLVSALQRNSVRKRGFWCLEKIGENWVLENMHNIHSDQLTPQHFSNICWSVAQEVDRLENALQVAAN